MVNEFDTTALVRSFNELDIFPDSKASVAERFRGDPVGNTLSFFARVPTLFRHGLFGSGSGTPGRRHSQSPNRSPSSTSATSANANANGGVGANVGSNQGQGLQVSYKRNHSPARTGSGSSGQSGVVDRQPSARQDSTPLSTGSTGSAGSEIAIARADGFELVGPDVQVHVVLNYVVSYY